MLQYLIEHGHKYYDLIYTYPIKQVWLFYEKALLIRRKEQHEEALMMAHAMHLPLGGKEANQAYQKYMDSLLPKSVKSALNAASRKSRPQDKVDPQKAIQNAIGGALPVGLPGRPGKKRKK